MTSSYALKAAVLLSLALPGCALLRKGEPLHVRYFSPELSASGGRSDGGPAPLVSPRVRLGRVSAGPHLGQRLTVRTSAVEVAYLEDMRWTERPEAFVRRELSQELFERRGMSSIVSGPGPVLEVTLVALEEVRAAKPRARFQATITLSIDRVALLEQTITEELEISASGSNAVIEGLVQVLAQGVARIADATQRSLVSQAAAKAPSAQLTP